MVSKPVAILALGLRMDSTLRPPRSRRPARPRSTTSTCRAPRRWRRSRATTTGSARNARAFPAQRGNLTDDDRPQWSGYGTLAANALLNGNPRKQVLSTFTQFDPRKSTLTTSVNFW